MRFYGSALQLHEISNNKHATIQIDTCILLTHKLTLNQSQLTFFELFFHFLLENVVSYFLYSKSKAIKILFYLPQQ
jgi:hypothetical protein